MTENDAEADHEQRQLRQLARYVDDLKGHRMPFGRYGPEKCPPNGKLVFELPLEYLQWFAEKGGGFPSGRLGELMQFVMEVKSAGAEEVFAALRERTTK